jgi:hypothetical protein
MDFNEEFVVEARKINTTEALLIISNMTESKKHSFGVMMHETAHSDGHLHEAEAATILAVLSKTGMIEDKQKPKSIDLSDIYFTSKGHIRYQNGEQVSQPEPNSTRAVKIESNISGNAGYSVTIYNLEGSSIWGDQIQMAPKQMKIISENNVKIVLRGYGVDQMGSSFSDYGITIHLEGDKVHSMVLHMHDRNIDIEYLP